MVGYWEHKPKRSREKRKLDFRCPPKWIEYHIGILYTGTVNFLRLLVEGSTARAMEPEESAGDQTVRPVVLPVAPDLMPVTATQALPEPEVAGGPCSKFFKSTSWHRQ